MSERERERLTLTRHIFIHNINFHTTTYETKFKTQNNGIWKTNWRSIPKLLEN